MWIEIATFVLLTLLTQNVLGAMTLLLEITTVLQRISVVRNGKVASKRIQ